MTLQKKVASALKKIAVIFLGVILSLVFLEAGLRLGGFVLLSIQEYGNLRSIKQKGAYRILCIGESTTQGQYPHFLEQILNERNIGVHFSVIDKGKVATNSSKILGQVESYLTEYRPDMVVAMMGTNDAMMGIRDTSGVRYYQDIPESGTWLFRHCRVYRFGRILAMQIINQIKRVDIYGFNRTNLQRPKKGPRWSGPSQSPDKFSEAEESFATPAELGCASGAACIKSGRLCQEQGKFHKAEDLFRKAIELDPNDDKAYVELGKLYSMQPANYPPAEGLFSKAFELNPRNSETCSILGKLYGSKGDFMKAEDLFKQVIRSDPNSAQAYFELGWLYRVQGKLPQAVEAFKRSLDLFPGGSDSRVFAAMATLYEETGKPELAKKYAEKARGTRFWECLTITANNYHQLKRMLDKKGIKLVCVQYPMRGVTPLKEIFKKDARVIFVDNEKTFKTAVRKEGFREYFIDMFAGDFGHCTQKGNMLLAQNIADVILRELFHKR